MLYRRGVIDFTGSRSGGESLIDDYDRLALDEILRDLEPLFTWNRGGPIRYSGATPGKKSVADARLATASDSAVDAFDQQ